ncbi:MAG: DNA mismatch repair endonuclease MutL [Deltaproteobacteria bacterium]|nr:DNA mismatch repair endonuclease MutL [Deltaproteobacteria bacterium]
MDSPRIRVLPQHLVNQIAAGEVVENAASVVKELVENAIDAGAARVTVEAERGGLDLVRVTDDGCGMTPDEAILAIERHATSKIASAEDLAAIRTLGFRGEALPSIASVATFEMATRTRDADAGTRVSAAGGTVRSEPAACPPGTSISVRDLFRDVPARLKFQKGERTQSAAIRDVLDRIALANPRVHMSLISNGRRAVEHLPCERLADRVAVVFGREASGETADVAGGRDGVRVTGVLGEPSRAKPDPSRVVLLVNGRPVFDLAIRRAVASAYGVLLPQGSWPVAVVRVDLDPADVDVNVHPRKSEVRFRSPREVAGIVFGVIAEAVASAPWSASTTVASPAPAGGASAEGRMGGASAGGPIDPAWTGAREAIALPWPAPVEAPPPPLRDHDLFATPVASRGRMRFADLRYVGQVANTVLVCEGDGVVVFVDQHAAHERVNYERLWRGLSGGGIASEPLMFPEVVRLPPDEAGRVEDAVPSLARAGFEVEPWSGDSVAVRAVPAVLRGRSAAAVVRECLAAASDGSEASGDSRIRKVVATVACHASVRAGDPLDEREARALLASMDGIDLAGYCPHGRQSVVVHPLPAVLRWFGR